MPLLSSPGDSQNEIQRQNRITQRIIANFLERRLFPFRRPQNDVPTIDEILPAPTKDPPKIKYGEYGGGGGRKRFRPKTAIDLLRGRAGFKPSHPKYKSANSSSGSEEAGEDQDKTNDSVEDYFDEDYADAVNQEEANYDNYDVEDGSSTGDNSTTEDLTRDRDLFDAAGIGAVLGDYDDVESLQTVESEHFNSFYRNQNKRYSGGNRFYLDDDFYEGRCRALIIVL